MGFSRIAVVLLLMEAVLFADQSWSAEQNTSAQTPAPQKQDSSDEEKVEALPDEPSGKGAAPTVAVEKKVVLAQDDPGEPQLDYRWIGPRGNVVNVNWRSKHEWTWTKIKNTDQLPSLVLKIWLELPKQIKLQKVRGSVLRVLRDTKDSPIEDPKGEIIAIETLTKVTQVTFNVTLESGSASEFSLLLHAVSNKPYIYEHPSCIENGVQMARYRQASSFFYMATRCIKKSETDVDFFLFTSEDALITNTNVKQKTGQGANWYRFKITKPKAFTTEKPKTIGMVRVKDKSSNASSDMIVMLVPKASEVVKGEEASRWSFSTGASGTMGTYSETPRKVNMTQYSLTGKFNVSYQLVPRKWSLGGNIFGTLVTFTKTPNTVASPRFIGINGRLGYRIPVDWLGMDWYVHTGWYIWSMLVPGKSYGISSMAGPQIFGFVTRFRQGSRSFYSYFKIAPIFATIGLPNPNNRELAIGGGYQLSPPNTRMWMLTLDVADTQASVTLNKIENSIKLTTISLGVQVSL